MIIRHKQQTVNVEITFIYPNLVFLKSWVGVGDDKKIPRHTESAFSDTALKMYGFIHLKIQVFPLLWKRLLIRVPRNYVFTSVSSLHQPCSSQHQNISIISMCLIH